MALLENVTCQWCACGVRQQAPWCDSRHGTIAFRPVLFNVPPSRTRYLCGCRHAQPAVLRRQSWPRHGRHINVPDSRRTAPTIRSHGLPLRFPELRESPARVGKTVLALAWREGAEHVAGCCASAWKRDPLGNLWASNRGPSAERDHLGFREVRGWDRAAGRPIWKPGGASSMPGCPGTTT